MTSQVCKLNHGCSISGVLWKFLFNVILCRGPSQGLTGVQIVYQTQFFKEAPQVLMLKQQLFDVKTATLCAGATDPRYIVCEKVSAALSLGGEMAVYGSNSFTNLLLVLRW